MEKALLTKTIKLRMNSAQLIAVLRKAGYTVKDNAAVEFQGKCYDNDPRGSGGCTPGYVTVQWDEE